MLNQKLAADIEQFMHDRGEYNCSKFDRPVWLMSNSRKKNVQIIAEDIRKGTVFFLKNYFDGELARMEKGDELVPQAENLLRELSLV